MSRLVRQAISQRLRQSEAAKTCLVHPSGSMRRALDRLVQQGAVLRPIPGGYARPEYWLGLTPLEQVLHEIRGLSMLHPGWVFCRTSAAAIHGLWVSNRLLRPHCVATSKAAHGSRSAAVQRCNLNLRPLDIETMGNIPVTTLLRTTLDCLRHLEFEEALIIADSSLRRSGMTSDELVQRLRTDFSGYPGFSKALFAASHANGLSESGGESLARAIMIQQGFMSPELQVKIPDPFDPSKTYRADFCWELPNGTRVLGEFDGQEKYRNPVMTRGKDAIDVLAEERLRESRLGASGARVMRFSYADICDVPFFVRLLEQYGIPRVSRPRRRSVTRRAGRKPRQKLPYLQS